MERFREGVDPIIDNRKILAGLISAGSIRGAAQACGCSATTIRKRLADPVFKEEYDKAKSELLTEATGELVARLNDSTAVLAEIMTDAAAPPGVRLQAADCVLRHAARYLTLSEIERRISALEATDNEEKL